MAGTGAFALRRSAILLTASCIAAFPASTQAGDWRTTASVSHTTTYDNNPQLEQDGRQSNTLREVSPSILSAYESETYGLDLDLSGTMVRSRNKTVTGDSTRLELNAANDLDFDRLRLFADVSLTRRANEATEFNDNELTTDASNASVSNDDEVEEMTLSSRGEWDLSELVTLFGTHEYRDVQFSGEGDSFVNNEYALGASWILSERMDLSPSIGFTRLEPENEQEDNSNLLRADLSANYLYNDKTLATITVGILDFEDERDFSLDAQFQRSFEKSTLSLGLSRDVSPGDESELEVSDSATLGVSYDFSDLTRANVDAQFRENEDTESQRAGFSLVHTYSDKISFGIDLDWIESTDLSDVSEPETTQYRADPFVNWTINEDINARLSYRELQERETDQETVRSRRVSFTIRYSKQYD